MACDTWQVLSCAGSGSYAGVIAGIEWAVQHSAASNAPGIISMSLGRVAQRTTRASGTHQRTHQLAHNQCTHQRT